MPFHIFCLLGYAHPSGNIKNNVLLGRLGGIMAYKAPQSIENIEEISKGQPDITIIY